MSPCGYIRRKLRSLVNHCVSSFAQVGPTKLIQLDRPETFLQVLTLAVDRGGAHQILKVRLTETNQHIEDAQRLLDDSEARVGSFTSRIRDAAIIEEQVIKEEIDIIKLQEKIAELIDTRELLECRMVELENEQRVTWTKLYELHPVFLTAVDVKGIFEGTEVPTVFMSRFRTAMKAGKAVAASRKRAADARDGYYGAHAIQPAFGKVAHSRTLVELRKLWRDSEKMYQIQRSNQDDREMQLLHELGPPFLAAMGYLATQRRVSDASSMSRVVAFGRHPNGDWSGRQVLALVDDGVLYPTQMRRQTGLTEEEL